MKFWYNPNFLAIVALLVLSIPALKSLAIGGFYTSHDGETHTARIAQYYQALADGQLPPRFAGSFYNGLGSPIFVYIYPLPYFLGSLVHLLSFSFTDSFEILMALGFIFSAIFSYLWLKEVFKSEKAAFLGALFYVWAPYRFSLIYVRASISELLAYTFLPLVFYSYTKLAQKNNLKWVALCALSIALLFLSQNLVAMITLPVIGFYILIQTIYFKSLKYFIYSVISSLWGLAIAAITYLPSIFERNFVRLDEIIKVAYENHFVTLKQLIRSPWGYGFDLPGTVNDQMSFQIGLAHLLIFALVLFLIIYFVLKKFMPFEKIGKIVLDEISQLPLILTFFFIIIFLITISLMIQTKPSLFIWQHIHLLKLIDIPWRFLGVTILSLSFLTAFVAKTIKPGLIFLFLIIFVLVANRNHLRINQILIRDDQFFSSYTGTATQYDEFTPEWRQSTRVPIGFVLGKTVERISGEADIYNVLTKTNRVSFDAEVFTQNVQIRINKFYFPGVSVRDNKNLLFAFNDLTITNPSSLHLEKEQDASGLMLINLAKGKHQVNANFGETPLRLFADYLSLGSLFLAIGVIVTNVKK
ncbi:hypothetical protein A2W70_05310 [Candidatus Curtissbacteria bacterium RIFCSPLOWO2_02_41_11]|uniref:Membrane protein 6-pyruvoyl-tetrahydropterin synthase-related domain-containing protein n=3 Tax=Candidatus Curtissiibacteriota TaxID=1752717 RepID=A0A1F5HPR1_9BACT|nr:MAG: hypothetical protein UU56_C0009G0009 [Candidatus Curtissbacteria bacterium GW2011_GWA2_41_24]OGD90112.1 MAG: hypothetical protein A2Z54_00925 [Candidatus Curtissbacteria bacterium RIFCSPHIGHO2_02_39_8]OGE06134.1 MAG: hypothetical protein A2W70_05310 [Candidatus Curtissbacteria bacterium RIFCSPLOWO2_02_41_11]